MNALLGVPVKAMSDMGRIGRGRVSVWHVGLLVEIRACGPLDSGAVVAIGASTLHCTVVASASFM